LRGCPSRKTTQITLSTSCKKWRRSGNFLGGTSKDARQTGPRDDLNPGRSLTERGSTERNDWGKGGASSLISSHEGLTWRKEVPAWNCYLFSSVKKMGEESREGGRHGANLHAPDIRREAAEPL